MMEKSFVSECEKNEGLIFSTCKKTVTIDASKILCSVCKRRVGKKLYVFNVSLSA